MDEYTIQSLIGVALTLIVAAAVFGEIRKSEENPHPNEPR